MNTLAATSASIYTFDVDVAFARHVAGYARSRANWAVIDRHIHVDGWRWAQIIVRAEHRSRRRRDREALAVR
jgi:hypothetical protein